VHGSEALLGGGWNSERPQSGVASLTVNGRSETETAYWEAAEVIVSRGCIAVGRPARAGATSSALSGTRAAASQARPAEHGPCPA
jgi:hypothetical protein